MKSWNKVWWIRFAELDCVCCFPSVLCGIVIHTHIYTHTTSACRRRGPTDRKLCCQHTSPDGAGCRQCTGGARCPV